MKKFIFATAVILFLPNIAYQILMIAFNLWAVIDLNIIAYTISTIITIQMFWGFIIMSLFFIAWVTEEKDEAKEKRKEAKEEDERQSRSK